MGKDQKGMAIVEVLVAIGLLSLLVVSFGNVMNSVNRLNRQASFGMRAQQLAQAAMEIAVSKKAEMFSLGLAGGYYLDAAGSWQALPPLGKENLGGEANFKRRIEIINTHRDAATNNIAEIGSEDTDTKTVTVTVWYTDRNSESSVSFKTVLTNWENI